MTYWVRFVGDPTGYVIEWDSSDRPHGWMDATAGGRRVVIDVDKAYVIEAVHQG